MPIVGPKESTGPFVRALVEDEAPGTKLLAYDSYLNIGEVVDTWLRVSGKEVDFVEVSIEVMNKQFGIPIEVLDGSACVEEFGYNGRIETVIEPGQLKSKPVAKLFEMWLKERDLKEVLGAGDAVLKSVEGK